MKPHLRQQWVIPAGDNAAFVASMEHVLDYYQRPLDAEFPVVNMDEQPVQLKADLRENQPMQPGQVERVDSEYERKGVVSLFLFTEALSGWRRVSVRERRTAVDWAEEVKVVLEEVYPEAQRVILVCDNLNTHTFASLYKAFPAAQARRLCSRLELVYTPKHGSWLNIAEIELSVLTRQCLSRRIPDLEILRSETQAWQTQRNAEAKGVDWQFTTQDARIRLKRLYPQF